MAKRGRLSKDEMAYIRAGVSDGKTPEKIASDIDRTAETVAEYIKLHVPQPKPSTKKEQQENEKVVIRQELRNSEAWRNLKNEFVIEELRYFEEAYIKLMAQFKDDVLASEETQILQAIKYEILMSRNLKERRKAREDIIRLEEMQEDFLKQFGGDPSQMDDGQKDFALNLETQLHAARQSAQMHTNEYTKLQERHADLMKGLKAIRDQRLKQFDSPKVSFIDVIKQLAEKEVQEREGRRMELVKMAGQKEYERLGQPHKFEDNNEDTPILSAGTVGTEE
jgi:hypothetical protein